MLKLGTIIDFEPIIQCSNKLGMKSSAPFGGQLFFLGAIAHFFGAKSKNYFPEIKPSIVNKISDYRNE